MSRLSQSSINRQQHIPQHIQQAMDQHMQTMPAHLQRQMGNGAYMSSHAQRAVTDHMQKTMPAHLKQYAGAYMEQRVLSSPPGTSFSPSSTVRPHPPVPNRLRQDHPSSVPVEQSNAAFHNDLFKPDAVPEVQQPQAVAGGPVPGTPADTPPDSGHPPGYEFLADPGKPSRRGLSLPGSGSPIIRVGVVLGGLLVLLIIFAVIKSAFTHSNTTQLVSVAQDQQEIVHLTSKTSTQQSPLSTTSQNFATTAQLSVASAQSQLLDYLKANGKKVTTKTLALKVSKSTDDQLAAAASNSTYDSTFQQVMRDQLKRYEQDLKQAYDQTSGPKGRALLKQQYNGAQLLMLQLDTPGS